MATSGSTNYTIDRDSLIDYVYRNVLGAISAGSSPTPNELANAVTALQIMLKSFQADGLQLWVIKKAILIPEKGAQSYDLGLTGDHCSLIMYKTELSADEAIGQTVLSIDSNTNMSNSDNIGIVDDDGTIHWTTISSSTSTEVTIASATTVASAENNHVYFYTNKIDRPHHVLEVYRREWDTVVDVPLIKFSRDEYYTLSDKDEEGTPVNYYYDPQLTNSVLYNWTTADSNFSSNNVFVVILRKPFDDMDSGTDDFEFPQEWYEPIALGLGKRLAKSVHMPLLDRQLLIQEADIAYDLAITWSVEDASVLLQPNES